MILGGEFNVMILAGEFNVMILGGEFVSVDDFVDEFGIHFAAAIRRILR